MASDEDEIMPAPQAGSSSAKDVRNRSPQQPLSPKGIVKSNASSTKRPGPTIKKVWKALQIAWKTKQFKAVIPSMHLFERGKLDPHYDCFVLLSACLSAMSLNEDAKLYHIASKSRPLIVPVRAPKPVDYFKKLDQKVRNPCVRQRHLVHIDAKVDVMKKVERNVAYVDIRLPLLTNRPTKQDKDEDYIRTSGSVEINTSNVSQEDALMQSRNKAAADCISRLEELVKEHEHRTRERLAKYIAENVRQWKTRKYMEKCYGAFKKTKEMISKSSLNELYGAKVFLYGSVTTGLCLSDSDIDVAIALPRFANHVDEDKLALKKKNVRVLMHLEHCAKQRRMLQVHVIATANVPLLRFVDQDGHIEVDITLANDQAILLSRFFRAHLQVDRRIWELSMMVKRWAKRRKLTGAPQEYINSMGWTVMVIYFLQHCVRPPMRIAGLFETRSQNGTRTTIHPIEWKDSPQGRGVEPSRDNTTTPSTGDLFVQFIQFYGHLFNYSRDAISLNCERPYQRIDIARGGHDAALFIEQPLHKGINIVAYVPGVNLEKTKDELRKAYDICIRTGNGKKMCEPRTVEENWNDPYAKYA